MRISDWSSDVCSSDLVEGADKVVSIVNVRPEYGLEQYRLMYERPGAVTNSGVVRLVNETVRPGVALFIVESGLHPFSPEARRRSDERRVGKECVRSCRSRWFSYH